MYTVFVQNTTLHNRPYNSTVAVSINIYLFTYLFIITGPAYTGLQLRIMFLLGYLFKRRHRPNGLFQVKVNYWSLEYFELLRHP